MKHATVPALFFSYPFRIFVDIFVDIFKSPLVTQIRSKCAHPDATVAGLPSKSDTSSLRQRKNWREIESSETKSCKLLFRVLFYPASRPAMRMAVFRLPVLLLLLLLFVMDEAPPVKAILLISHHYGPSPLSVRLGFLLSTASCWETFKSTWSCCGFLGFEFCVVLL